MIIKQHFIGVLLSLTTLLQNAIQLTEPLRPSGNPKTRFSSYIYSDGKNNLAFQESRGSSNVVAQSNVGVDLESNKALQTLGGDIAQYNFPGIGKNAAFQIGTGNMQQWKNGVYKGGFVGNFQTEKDDRNAEGGGSYLVKTWNPFQHGRGNRPLAKPRRPWRTANDVAAIPQLPNIDFGVDIDSWAKLPTLNKHTRPSIPVNDLMVNIDSLLEGSTMNKHIRPIISVNDLMAKIRHPKPWISNEKPNPIFDFDAFGGTKNIFQAGNILESSNGFAGKSNPVIIDKIDFPGNKFNLFDSQFTFDPILRAGVSKAQDEHRYDSEKSKAAQNKAELIPQFQNPAFLAGLEGSLQDYQEGVYAKVPRNLGSFPGARSRGNPNSGSYQPKSEGSSVGFNTGCENHAQESGSNGKTEAKGPNLLGYF